MSNDFEVLECGTISELRALVRKLQDFKNYTHKRLDDLGAPHDVPGNEHSQAGCRVGARFDWVEKRLNNR